jgi:hypothetical protein
MAKPFSCEHTARKPLLDSPRGALHSIRRSARGLRAWKYMSKNSFKPLTFPHVGYD